MGLIKKILIKRALKKAAFKTDMEKVADETLKDALKELQQTTRTTNKIMQAKLIRQENRHALDAIHALDDELDDDDEPATESFEEKLITNILPQLFKQKTNDDGFGETSPSQNNTLETLAKSLSPEDLKALKDKFLKS